MTTSNPVVLLIDDEQSLTYLIQRYGSACDCQVVSIQVSEEAQSIFARMHPVVMMVHVTPLRLDTWEVIQALKNDPITRGCPLVVICATGIDAVNQFGADYSLLKPVLFDDFRAVLVACGALPPPA